jgi:hypothetical protein
MYNKFGLLYFEIKNYPQNFTGKNYNVVSFLLGNSLASELYIPTFRNTLFHLHRPMKMEQTECHETSAYNIQTPENYPEENTQHTEQGESWKSRRIIIILWLPLLCRGSSILDLVMLKCIVNNVTSLLCHIIVTFHFAFHLQYIQFHFVYITITCVIPKAACRR